MAINLSPGTPPAPNASQKVMTGGRAIISVNNLAVGIFESVTYNLQIGTEAIHILGRFSPDEITVTSQEAVTLTCAGFRVIGNGPYVLPAVPTLQDLLSIEGATITVVDRQTNQTILTVIGAIATGYSGNFNAKATSRITINYTGLRFYDESGAQDEAGATDLP